MAWVSNRHTISFISLAVRSRIRSDFPLTAFFDANPFYGPNALEFRGISDSLATHYLEASECCLIHADNPSEKGVWINPEVRLGYNLRTHIAVHVENWPPLFDRYGGLWKNRLARWGISKFWMDENVVSLGLKEWRVRRRVGKWRHGMFIFQQSCALTGRFGAFRHLHGICLLLSTLAS